MEGVSEHNLWFGIVCQDLVWQHVYHAGGGGHRGFLRGVLLKYLVCERSSPILHPHLVFLWSCNTWAMGGVLGWEVTNASERQCRILFNWDTLLLQGWNVFELLNRILSFLDTAVAAPMTKQARHLWRLTFGGESQSSFLSLFLVSSLHSLSLSLFC